MRVSLNWLKERVAFALSPQELADKLTMAGFEVEDIEDRRTWADGVVVGHILQADRHPNADKLQVCRVDVGQQEPLQIVCGAANARSGLKVAVATIGTFLPRVGSEGLKIRASKLRGEASQGMICSLSELGLEKESAGIHEFLTEVEVGSDVRPLLGLDDVILEVSSTANRADALSMVGIAREVAAFTGAFLTLPTVAPIPAVSQGAWLQVSEQKACPAYIGTLLQGITIGPSPLWLQQKLKAAGMRPINNVVDITNYILLEWGQPLHAFDADTLAQGFHIGVRFARKGETLKTLDGQERSLETSNLLITSQEQPIALAGVMGGEATEVSATTKNILLEAALFDQAAIRRSARAQGLRSEASARYERGVNQATLEIACAHALQLLIEIAGGEVVEQGIVDARQPLTRSITLSLEAVRSTLGWVAADTEEGESQEISETIVEGTLQRLGFTLKRLLGSGTMPENLPSLGLMIGADRVEIPPPFVAEALRHLGVSPKPETTGNENPIWEVTVPPYRYADIERPIDLIEEIARIYGYEKFIENLPPLTEGGYLPADQEFLRQLRACWRGVGLTEVMHNALRMPGELEQQVLLSNPIAQEYSALRTDLISGLLDACAFNLTQGNGVLQAFEIGRVFRLEEGMLVESDHIAGILGSNPQRTSWRGQPTMDWFSAKGLLEGVFDRFGLVVEFQPDRKDPRLHPGRTASLWIEGNRLGTFGQLHPQLRAERDFPDEVYIFELDLELLYEVITERPCTLFQNFSTFPPSDRDIAFFVKNDTSVAEIRRAIIHTGGALLESVLLFDEYRGEGVPTGLRSLAFRLLYRSHDRTLTEEDVNPIHQKVRDMLEERFQVTLRS